MHKLEPYTIKFREFVKYVATDIGVESEDTVSALDVLLTNGSGFAFLITGPKEKLVNFTQKLANFKDGKISEHSTFMYTSAYEDDTSLFCVFNFDILEMFPGVALFKPHNDGGYYNEFIEAYKAQNNEKRVDNTHKEKKKWTPTDVIDPLGRKPRTSLSATSRECHF